MECVAVGKKNCHCTPRRCSRCGKFLKDTLVNFGELLQDAETAPAWAAIDKADLLLVLGTSLSVAPACTMVGRVQANGGRVVIVNRQHTDGDAAAAIRIFAHCDEVMEKMLARLGVELQTFQPAQSKLVPTADGEIAPSSSHCPKSGEVHEWECYPTASACAVCGGVIS